MGAEEAVQSVGDEDQASCAEGERRSEEDQSQNNSFCPPALMAVEIFHVILCSALARQGGFSVFSGWAMVCPNGESEKLNCRRMMFSIRISYVKQGIGSL